MTDKNFSLNDAVLSHEQLMEADLPERKKLLPWLPEGGLIMVAAPRGIGKTFFGMDLAVKVASGGEFLKWEVENTAGVLYVDGEMPLGDFRERYSSFINHQPENFFILSHEWLWDKAETDLTITLKNIQDEMFDCLDSRPNIRLIVLDNLSSLSNIREDKSDDWRDRFLPFLIKCRRRGVAVLLIHHVNKSGEQRGTGAREDHLDASIVLKPLGGESNEGAQFKVEFTKCRGAYGEVIESFSAILKKEDDFYEWEIGDPDMKVKDRLVILIGNSGTDGVTVTEAAEELEVSKGAVSKAKSKLIEEGTIKAGKRMKLDKFPQKRAQLYPVKHGNFCD